MKKLFLFAIMAIVLVSCNRNEPSQTYEGVWEPVLLQDSDKFDLFTITSDSIKAFNFQLGIEYYQCHYRFIRNGIIELERCWAMRDNYPEAFWKEEVPMYFDEEGYLIIERFDPSVELHQNYPNYANLKLKRYEEN